MRWRGCRRSGEALAAAVQEGHRRRHRAGTRGSTLTSGSRRLLILMILKRTNSLMLLSRSIALILHLITAFHGRSKGNIQAVGVLL
uniref:Uncharacterized protein n=1 Tax=Arundo donax TaxID=35708 RepID=A0A0A8Z473_ARUDO